MSRLTPAYGLGMRGGGQQNAPSKQHQAFESDTGFLMDKVTTIARECIDATLQSGDLDVPIVACWHPSQPLIAVATTAALAVYDGISGSRRTLVDMVGTPLKMRYTADGSTIIVLSAERIITAWSTTTWRRKVILPQDPKYAKRPLIAGLLAIGATNQSNPAPVVYYSPMGKTYLQTIQTLLPTVAKGQKLDRELLPGFKLRTDNKKPIVGLASHPTEPGIVFIMLLDGTLITTSIANGTMTMICGVNNVPFDAKRERIQLQAVTISGGSTLVIVEAEKSGVTLIEAPSRNEARLLATLNVGAPLCGVGYLPRSSLLVVTSRHAGGNVGIRGWRVLRDGRDVVILATSGLPNTLWDALQGGKESSSSSIADVSGDAIVSGMVSHSPTGLLAFWTGAHFRLPVVQLMNGTASGLGAVSSYIPLHTGPSFWTDNNNENSHASTSVSKLRFPRYTHLVTSTNRVVSHDVTHGLVTDYFGVPGATAAGQQRRLVKAIKSSKQGVWLAFTQVVSPQIQGALLGPGQYEWTAIGDDEAAVSQGERCYPGRDGAFVGGREELTAVVSNSGGLIAVFETAKLPSGGKALYAAEAKDGLVVAVYSGPPVHIPAAPTPPPDVSESNGSQGNEETDDEAEAAYEEWQQKEAKRLEPPKLLLIITADNTMALVEVSPSAVTYSSAARSLPSKYTLKLRASELVTQVAWQNLMPPHGGYHAGLSSTTNNGAIACAAAVLTTERVLIVDDKLNVLASTVLPNDVGSPVSCLWLGPALLVSTASNMVFQLGWDGAVTHICSLLSTPPVVLLGALADRLILALKSPSTGAVEVASRGCDVLAPMLTGWAGLASIGIVPGGKSRIKQEIKTLLTSYDASQLPVAVLQQLATCGFADVAAAAAASSESSAVTPSFKAVLAASAGDWSLITQLVMSEIEDSLIDPTYNPYPAKNSPAYTKAVALARACMKQGRFIQARQLFKAAGAWNDLLALCVFQGDFMAVQAYAREAPGRDVEALADQLLAVNENAFRSSTGGVYGGRANTDNWTVKPQVIVAVETSADIADAKAEPGSPTGVNDDEEVVSGDDDDSDGSQSLDNNELEFEIAPAGRLPFMEASLAVSLAAAASGILPPPPVKQPAAKKPTPTKDSGGGNTPKQTPTPTKKKDEKPVEDEDETEEGQPIPRLDLHTLEAYLGVPGAKMIRGTSKQQQPPLGSSTSAIDQQQGTGGTTTTPRIAGLERSETGTSTDLVSAMTSAAALAQQHRLSMDDDMYSESSSAAPTPTAAAPSAIPRAGETAAQAAARAAFGKSTINDEDDFFSSDEESNDRFSDTQSMTSMGTAGASMSQKRFSITIKSREEMAADAARAADSSSLKAAASGLKLGGPGSLTARSTPSSAQAAQSTAFKYNKSNTNLLDTGDSFESADMGGGFPSLSGLPSIIPPPAAAAAATTSGPAKDPFSNLDGISTLGSGSRSTLQQSDSASNVLKIGGGVSAGAALPATPFGGSDAGASSNEPMRAQPAPLASQNDLLSGWDEFEAMFGADDVDGGEQPSTGAAVVIAAQQDQQQQQQPALVASNSGVMSRQPSEAQLQGADLAQLSSKARKSMTEGTSLFAAGQWDKAKKQYAKCIDGGATQEVIINLYAAASLLQLASKAQPDVAARLARFAASLQIEGPARNTLSLFTAESNMAAKNYGYAAEHLTWLVIQATEGGGVPGVGTDDLQKRLNTCDAAGLGNASLPEDEDVDTFAAILGSCSSRAEIDELLTNLG